MKWTPGECVKGDIVRVRLGSGYHYGVFVSEDEVIQFGYPPLPEFADKNADPRVCAVDADTFCCGKMIERGIPVRSDKSVRRTPDEAVALARSRIGEGGYNVIHNNCEHFARECVLGAKRSEQEEELRRRWHRHGLLDVYVMPVPDGAEPGHVDDPEREAYIYAAADPSVRLCRYPVWELLGKALRRSSGIDISALRFSRALNGKWSADGAPEFSLSHCRGAVCVSVSDTPSGVDIENNDAFDRFGDKSVAAARMLCHGEHADGRDGLLAVWTKKESIFKMTAGTVFEPKSIKLKRYETSSFRLPGLPDLTVSVAGRTSALRCYVCGADGIRGVTPQKM